MTGQTRTAGEKAGCRRLAVNRKELDMSEERRTVSEHTPFIDFENLPGGFPAISTARAGSTLIAKKKGSSATAVVSMR
jgi:hypothetical protein